MQSAVLIIERGPEAGKRIALAQFPITIGRDSANKIVIEDDEVSRFHLRIKRRGRLYICEDLESRNGTYINGDRVLNSILQNNDKLLVGTTEFQFVTSEPNIQLTNEITAFDMIIAEDLGLKGPIEVGKAESSRKFTPQRLNQLAVINQSTTDSKALKEIYDLHSNILVINHFEEASKALLKSISKLMPSATKLALFMWSPASRHLIPIASRHIRRKKESFLLSQRAFDDVIARKQGLIVPLDGTSDRQASISQRIVLPMVHHEDPICILHIEVGGGGDDSGLMREIELAQALISRCAPSFENLLLRRELDAWMVGMIETMVATIEAKDTYTHGHSERVSRYSMVIADELKLNREIKRLLLISALCHDIGKIGIPDAILKKASMLSAEEYEEMKLHPAIGSDIVSHMPNAQRFISGVKHHHEKWDGTGYPDGLVGEDIPFFGRIVGIADVFDAMVSGRAYSGFIDQTDAIERIQEEKELFDPEILKAMVRAHDSGTLTLKTSTANNAIDPTSGPRTTQASVAHPDRLTVPPKGKRS